LSIDVERLRQRFPTLAHKTYLNSGSYGLLSLDVRRAFEEYLASRDERGSEWEEWVARSDAVRTRTARLLNAQADEIAVTASASAGINALATALDFTGPRNTVVASDFEFPTSGQIWHAQERRGARIVHVPETADGFIPLEHFERAIDERTSIVALAQVCYRNGAMLDVAEIARMAHRKGARVLLDCFQAVGVAGVDVKALDVDFAVGGMLKYLLGTAGIGFLYVRSELIESLVPTVSGWFAQANPYDMDIYHNIPSPTARRFQAGTPPVPNCYAAAAGLDIILELGIDSIESYVRQLTRRCMDRVLEAGFQLATPLADAHRGPSVCIRSSDENALVAKLAERNIVSSCRDGNLRAMFHCYNNDADVDSLLAALLANRKLLRQ
jgi:selenocysteine lyase/cysteine desulfurase